MKPQYPQFITHSTLCRFQSAGCREQHSSATIAYRTIRLHPLQEEAYWDPKPDFSRPISARNEAAALSWLLDHQAGANLGKAGRSEL